MNETIIPAGILDTEELLRYAQMYLDRGDNIPLPWQEELLRRFRASIDELNLHECGLV